MIKHIKVDLSLCEREGITPTVYCWLYLLYKEDDRYATSFRLNDKVIDHLIERDFINKDLELSKKTLSLFKQYTLAELDKKFLELWELFPNTVPNGRGGIRILRARNADSEDGKVCKAKYLNIIKDDPDLHDNIIKCLKKQLEIEQGNLQFMNGLQVWLNQRIYEKYEGIEEETKDYGENL